jgi:transposase
MRYATGGGLTAGERDRRERVRMEAAERFARGELVGQVAVGLRVGVRSVQRWNRAWCAGGAEALRSAGPASRCRLGEEQLERLDAELERGAVAHGWVDERWTLARVRELVVRLFGVGYTVPGVWLLLRRRGWSCQLPVRRAVERDDGAVEVWRREAWTRVKGSPRSRGPGSSSRTRPGRSCDRRG